MKKIDWNNVEEAKGFEKLPAGAYICGITAVEDEPTKEYLKFEADIAEGEFKNYYRNLYEAKGFWGLHFIKSYKEKAQGFFKKMLTAFENSNPNFRFDNDEKILKRKLIGLVIGYEEYEGNDGSIKERVQVVDFISIDDVRKGNFTVPALKKLEIENLSNYVGTETQSDISDEDLPF